MFKVDPDGFANYLKGREIADRYRHIHKQLLET